MDLIALAVPFFLLALTIELIVDRVRKTRLYRGNDAINSISTGMLRTTFGYFTRFLPLLAFGFVLENFALIDMPLSWFDASPAGIALWITAALAWDFCYYWFHRFSHEISVLWASHAVHHQSEDYNLSTALRQPSTGFLFGWIFYLPLFVIGFPVEVLVTVNAVNLIYQFWVHTQFVRRMGVLDRILVTPSNHRVHHAQNARYIDKNYGGMLILWDRMFGTFADEREDEPVIFGVRKPLANWNPFWANLQVYDYLLFDALRTARWKDKLGHPGLAIAGVFPESIHPEFGATQGYQSLEMLREGFKLESLWASPAVLAVRTPGFGHELQARFAELPRIAAWDAIASTHRSLGTVTARRGRSLDPRITWRLDPEDMKLLVRALWVLAEMFFAAGAEKIIPGVLRFPYQLDSLEEAELLRTRRIRAEDLVFGGNHAFCTTRMHGDPRRGVVDEDGRCHDFDNLYIADTGIFPRCSSVNPMFTGMALAHRQASAIAERL